VVLGVLLFNKLTNLANATDHDDCMDVTNLIAFSLEDTKSSGSTVSTEESVEEPDQTIES
jgi:hypothetical protein